jgi:16S rRNA (uracil1498-N3)-methyltransferase
VNGVHRFFVAPEKLLEEEGVLWARIEGDDAHHIARVLRLRPGASVEVADGLGTEYTGTLTEVSPSKVRVRLGAPRPSLSEPAYRVTLFQGLPKSDKMDWVVQKAAEVGMAEVVPVTMERSVTSLTAAKAAGRVDRWQKIARSAAQQAARGRVPVVRELAALDEALADWRRRAPDGLLIVPWEEERGRGIKSLLQSAVVPREIGIVIGPEGGMTEEEIARCAAYGGQACTLGPRILRTETAGVVVAALVLYELGEMGG